MESMKQLTNYIQEKLHIKNYKKDNCLSYKELISQIKNYLDSIEDKKL